VRGGGCPRLGLMSPDPSGVAAPEDPVAAPEGAGSRPRFRLGVDRVDETTVDPADGATAAEERRHLLEEPRGDGGPAPQRRARLRARKVRRIVRHVEPWSVLKISVLFFLSMFLIVCVASAVLWNAARSAGAVDDVESFITSLGFGNCADIAGGTASSAPTTPSTIDGSGDQVGGVAASSTTVPAAPADANSTLPDKDGKCPEGQRLVGGFKFDDHRIFQAFALGGVVLVLAGAASSVVMAVLFNLISDLTGGVRVTVLEEESGGAGSRASGSPGWRRRG